MPPQIFSLLPVEHFAQQNQLCLCLGRRSVSLRGNATGRGPSLSPMAHNATHALRSSGEMKMTGRATSTAMHRAMKTEKMMTLKKKENQRKK